MNSFLFLTDGRERQRLATNQEEMEEMRQRDAERQVAMDRCLAKESELLEFTQRLTEKNVQLQSTLTSLEERTALDVGRKVELDQQLDETTGQLKVLARSIRASWRALPSTWLHRELGVAFWSVHWLPMTSSSTFQPKKDCGLWVSICSVLPNSDAGFKPYTAYRPAFESFCKTVTDLR